jgi:hypothetical protein
MRKFLSLCWLLAGCASHTVRCDAHLQPINLPNAATATAAAAAAVVPRSGP